MVTRETFNIELKSLRDLVLEMGQKASKALSDSIEALKARNIELAVEVIDNDYRINRLEEEINEKAVWLIAKEAPIATDLRRIIASIKISNDIERIGDLAVNIAKSTILIGEKELYKPLQDIPSLAQRVIYMLEVSLNAYIEENTVLAKEIAEEDDNIDSEYGRIIKELFQHMTENPDLIKQITQLAFICRFLERAADHTTNISESAIYLVKGKMYDLNA